MALDGAICMVAKRYENLEAWQLADELKREVYAITATGSAATDFGFRDQIRDAAASLCGCHPGLMTPTEPLL